MITARLIKQKTPITPYKTSNTDMSDDPKSLIKQAFEKSKPVSGFFWKLISSPEDQYEEAIDLYIQAAKIYRLGNGKVSKDYIKSADCYKEAAVVALERLENYNEAAMNYVEAYKLCKMGDEYNDDLFKSIKMYKNLIDTNIKRNLNLWIIKDYYLKVGLLQLLLTDSVANARI